MSRVGPIFLAHGGEWARGRELESLHWPLVDPVRISGKAVAIRPDHQSGGWRALTEWETGNAARVLERFRGGITQASMSRFHQVINGLSGEPLLRFVRGSREEQQQILEAAAARWSRRRQERVAA